MQAYIFEPLRNVEFQEKFGFGKLGGVAKRVEARHTYEGFQDEIVVGEA